MKVGEIEAIRKVAGFLAFAAKDGKMYNATTADEALRAFCSLTSLNLEQMKEIFVDG